MQQHALRLIDDRPHGEEPTDSSAAVDMRDVVKDDQGRLETLDCRVRAVVCLGQSSPSQEREPLAAHRCVARRLYRALQEERRPSNGKDKSKVAPIHGFPALDAAIDLVDLALEDMGDDDVVQVADIATEVAEQSQRVRLGREELDQIDGGWILVRRPGLRGDGEQNTRSTADFVVSQSLLVDFGPELRRHCCWYPVAHVNLLQPVCGHQRLLAADEPRTWRDQARTILLGTLWLRPGRTCWFGGILGVHRGVAGKRALQTTCATAAAGLLSVASEFLLPTELARHRILPGMASGRHRILRGAFSLHG